MSETRKDLEAMKAKFTRRANEPTDRQIAARILWATALHGDYDTEFLPALEAYTHATPTPPENGEVRDALLAALGDADTVNPHSARLARLLGLAVATWTPPQVADALLARVAPQGETADVRCRYCSEVLGTARMVSGEMSHECPTRNPHYIAATPPAAETGEDEVSPSDWRWLWRRCSTTAEDSAWRFCTDDDNPLPDFLAMRGLLEAHENGVWYREVQGQGRWRGANDAEASAIVSPQEPPIATLASPAPREVSEVKPYLLEVLDGAIADYKRQSLYDKGRASFYVQHLSELRAALSAETGGA